MAGGKGSRRRRAARGVAAAAAAGKAATLAESSGKRKAVADMEAVAGHLAPPLKEYAFGPEEAGDEEVAAADYTVADDNAAPAGEQPPRPASRMSTREIQWILNHDPTEEPSRYKELLRRNPSLIPPLQWEETDEDTRNLYFGAHMFYSLDASFPELLAWVRNEMENKGYIDMDGDWIRRRMEAEAILEELRVKIEAMCMYETGEEDDDDESDSDGEF